MIEFLLLVLPFILLILKIRESLKFKKVFKWTSFLSNIRKQVENIKDTSIRTEILMYLVEIQGKYSLEEMVQNSKKIDYFKNEICSKWGNHLPELKSEIRDKKLKEILK